MWDYLSTTDMMWHFVITYFVIYANLFIHSYKMKITNKQNR